MDLHGSATTTGRVNFERPQGRINEEKIRRETYPDSAAKQTPQCPECGACYSPKIDVKWANDHSLKLREYICAVCATIYGTVELVLPVGPRIAHYDEQHTINQREAARRRRTERDGKPYRGKGGQTPRTKWVTILGWAFKVLIPDTGERIVMQEGIPPITTCRVKSEHDH